MQYTEGTIVFDGWKIEKLIGEGSYGKVYKIAKTEYGITTTSALKVITIPQSQTEIKNAYSDGMDEKSVTTYFKDFVDEIVKEILVMSRVKSHPNVVSYEDHKVIEHEGSIGWDILIRMEYLTPFVDYQISHNISEADVAKIGMDLASALDYCHSKGLIHRDVKPENIFVNDAGIFKLGDFGVAKTIDKTTGGMSKKGTEVYMAPEVYIGKPYGSSVDTYSLGLVLYRLLNGNRLPFLPLAPNPIRFDDKENALICRIRGDVIAAPVNASSELADIILKACAYKTEERYKTAGEMCAALKGIEERLGFEHKVLIEKSTVDVIHSACRSEILLDDCEKTVGVFSETRDTVVGEESVVNSEIPTEKAEPVEKDEPKEKVEPVVKIEPIVKKETVECSESVDTRAIDRSQPEKGNRKFRTSIIVIIIGCVIAFAGIMSVVIWNMLPHDNSNSSNRDISEVWTTRDHIYEEWIGRTWPIESKKELTLSKEDTDTLNRIINVYEEIESTYRGNGYFNKDIVIDDLYKNLKDQNSGLAIDVDSEGNRYLVCSQNEVVCTRWINDYDEFNSDGTFRTLDGDLTTQSGQEITGFKSDKSMILDVGLGVKIGDIYKKYGTSKEAVDLLREQQEGFLVVIMSDSTLYHISIFKDEIIIYNLNSNHQIEGEVSLHCYDSDVVTYVEIGGVLK